MRDGQRAWLRIPGNPVAITGVAVDLSPSGALLKCVREVPLGTQGTLEVQLDDVLSLPVRVIRVDKETYRPFVGVGLQFGRLKPNELRALSALAPYVVERHGRTSHVTFRVGFTEATTFAALLKDLEGEVVFDVAGVRHISSLGVKKWVYFLEKLCAKGAKVRFVRCSGPFLKQAAMIRNFLGCGRIESALVAYTCEDCGQEVEVELRAGAAVPETRSCRCGGTMDPDVDVAVLEELLQSR